MTIDQPIPDESEEDKRIGDRVQAMLKKHGVRFGDVGMATIIDYQKPIKATYEQIAQALRNTSGNLGQLEEELGRRLRYDDPEAWPEIVREVANVLIPHNTVVVDREWFERVRAVARAVWSKEVGGPEWTGTYKDDVAISQALNAMRDSDIDPLP